MILSWLRVIVAAVLALLGGIAAIVSTPFDRNARFFNMISNTYSYVVLKICGVMLETEGTEHIDLARNYIYVANHASLFDIPIVIEGIPQQIRIVYKKELEKIPLFGWGLKISGVYIAIDRGRGTDAIQSLEATAEKIRTGASVLLFAEGTRSPDGKLQPFKRGAFNLAAMARVPIVPLTINGSYNILAKKSLRIRPGNVRLILDRPIEPPDQRGKEVELELRDRVRAAIEKSYVNQE